MARSDSNESVEPRKKKSKKPVSSSESPPRQKKDKKKKKKRDASDSSESPPRRKKRSNRDSSESPRRERKERKERRHSRSRSPPRRRRSPSPERGRRGRNDKMEGIACRWNEKGFGFIKPEDGSEDVFCHASSILDGQMLQDGARVRYVVSYDEHRGGKPRAEQVTGGCAEDGGPGGDRNGGQFFGDGDRGDRGGGRGLPPLSKELEEKLDEWVAAKRIRDFETSDRIRSELQAEGVSTEEYRPAPGKGGGGYGGGGGRGRW